MKFFKDPSGVKIWLEKIGDEFWVHLNGKNFPFKKSSQKVQTKEENKTFISNLKAPFPGRVVSVQIKENDRVKPYQHLIVVESMKMEHTLSVHHEAKIQAIHVKKGQSVEFDEVLIQLQPLGDK